MVYPRDAVNENRDQGYGFGAQPEERFDEKIKLLVINSLHGRAAFAALTQHVAETLQRWDLDLLVTDAVSVQAWPRSTQALIAARQREARLASTIEADALRTLLQALHESAIAALVLKGAAFAYTIYRQPWLRPRGDIDLLVAEDRLDDARRVAERLGYAYSVQVTDRLVTAQRELRRPGPIPVALDLHGRLVNPLLFDRLPGFAELASRSQAIPALGPDARTLDTIDALLHMLVHRVAHHYRRDSPVWLLDVHLLARTLNAEGWRETDRRVRSWQVAAIAADGLAATAAAFGTSVPLLNEWRAVEGEPSRALLDGPATELRIQRLSFARARGLGAKSRLLRAHLFPSGSYMLARYGTSKSWRLPELYLRRIVSGVVRWIKTSSQ